MWIFGYGSLMWDGWEATFDCKRKERAVLTGHARSFTKASIKNWGTKSAPGPTLGLIADAESECHGVAFEFDESRCQDVLAYLRKREGGFSEVSIDVALPSGERVQATTFVYAGANIILGKTDEDIARMVLRARGTDGAALEYVRDCKTNLKSVGIADPAVDKLWDAVERMWSKRLYSIDEEFLRPGDIILTSADTTGSKAIRIATGGEYSHAMVYVGHASIVDAMPEGVHARNTQRMHFPEGVAVKVLRFKGGLSDEAAKTVCDFARAQVGRQYATFDAARVVVAKGNTLSRKQFCSRLVAQAYRGAGLNIVGDANYCSPNEIGKSASLVPVEGAIRPVADEEITVWETMPDMPQRMRDATNAFLNAARAKGSAIQDFNDVDDWLIAHPEDDDFLHEALKKSGYLELWKEERDAYAWRYDPALIDALDAAMTEDIRAYCRATATMEDGGYRFAQNRAGYDYLAGTHNLKTFRAMAELYATLEELHRRRFAVARGWLRNHDIAWAGPALTGGILLPHTTEWFSALAASNPQQAAHTQFILSQEGKSDVCSVCGDEPTEDYWLPLAATPTGATMTLRLCEDCKGIRSAAGEDLVPLNE